MAATYGSVPENSDAPPGAQSSILRAASVCPLRFTGKNLRSPFFFENPDGSICEAVPICKAAANLHGGMSPGRMSVQSEGSPRARLFLRQGEVVAIFWRHEVVFGALLLMHCVFQMVYNVIYVRHVFDGSAAADYQMLWRSKMDSFTIAVILWGALLLNIFVQAAYFSNGIECVASSEAGACARLEDFGMLGMMHMAMLSFLGKFNAVIFFLYLLCSIYARFLAAIYEDEVMSWLDESP